MSTIEISYLFFLTSADQLGQNFVGDILLHNGNYSDWKSNMMNALFTKNKIGFVDGSLSMFANDYIHLMN